MGFSRVRGETRPDVYRAVEDARDAVGDGVPLEALADGIRADAALLLEAAAPLVRQREAFTRIAALAVAALDAIAALPGGRQ